MNEKTISKQEKQFRAEAINEHGEPIVIVATVRHDDSCQNGHNTFSVTGEIKGPGGFHRFGCIHEDIAKYLPELAPFIKWNLVSTDGPILYVSNTVYFVLGGNLDYARSSAVWPDATDEELRSPDLEARLAQRLPALMEEFKTAVESFGFTY